MAKRLQLKVTWSDLTHSHPHLRLEKKFPITRCIAAQLNCKTKNKKPHDNFKYIKLSCGFFCLFGFFVFFLASLSKINCRFLLYIQCNIHACLHIAKEKKITYMLPKALCSGYILFKSVFLEVGAHRAEYSERNLHVCLEYISIFCVNLHVCVRVRR